MKNFLTQIPSEDLLNILSIIITGITTYLITKYSASRPRKLEIKQKQFDNVYLPLYKLIKFHSNINMDNETSLKCAIEIKNILIENYELVFPQLHELINKFIVDIEKNNCYQETFENIAYQVNLDYILLKKTLGYPSDNIFKIFMRMKLRDKLNTVFGIFLVISLFGMSIIIQILTKYFSGINLLIAFIAYLGIGFILPYFLLIYEKK